MITTDKDRFLDEHGRSVYFRGINLGGNSKLPFDVLSHDRHAITKNIEASFVGRPFPLDQADEHFLRLKTWGFNLLRFVVPWEAIEHAGRGVYDEAYVDYATLMLEKAASYGFYSYIDPHQDVWSRFCGGDGAPAWTLELAGFDLEALAESGAATLHAIHGNPFPHMVWGTNYGKLASATMFTLFWAGRDLAPKTRHQGQSLQDILQNSYIAAFAHLAERLRHIPQVIGFGVMNEPSSGFIGVSDLRQKAHSLLLRGPSPSVLEAMGLGAGFKHSVEIWELGLTGLRLKRVDEVNKNNISAWYPNTTPIWQENGVWAMKDQQLELLRPHHFSHVGGKKIHFYRDYYIPFAKRYMAELNSRHPSKLFFVEGIPADPELYWPTPKHPAKWKSQSADPNTGDEDSHIPIVHAPHWYDVATLISKRFFPWLTFDAQKNKLVFGHAAVNRAFRRQLKAMKDHSERHMGHAPTLIGEVGIPMDLHRKKAYQSGNYTAQVKALDRSLSALEDTLLSYCIWNYTATNSHDHGDGWNAEDFSIYSPESPTQRLPTGLAEAERYLGGRALEAFIRPYALTVAGKVVKMRFDLRRKTFELVFHSDQTSASATSNLSPIASVIFVPDFHYPQGYSVTVSDGDVSQGKQEILYFHSCALTEHSLVIKPS